MLQQYQVAVEAPISNLLTYQSDLDLHIGDSVIVPLGARQSKGVVVNSVSHLTTDDFKIKNILSLNTERERLSKSYVKWVQWISDYYVYPVGQIFPNAFPPLKKKKEGSKSKTQELIFEEVEAHQLNTDQQKVFEDIRAKKGFGVHLLHGVTGSGKTEVYMRLFEEVFKDGQQGLFLLPEISLTPQLLKRFSQRFPGEITSFHSQLTDRNKTNQWWDFYTKKSKLMLGARSALFCPSDNIGLIVLDEEHEPSYKQDEKLKYHARDAAIVLGKLLNVPVVLGSATPSLETWHNVELGKFNYHQLKNRISGRSMPDVTIVDLAAHKKEGTEKSPNAIEPYWLSEELYNELLDNYENKKQAALFLNRRGFANWVQCLDCGYTFECDNCSISLTLHNKSHLVCHYCDFSRKLPEHCPECESIKIKTVGLGTEQIEADLQKLFPESRIARADRDQIQKKQDLDDLIYAFEKNEYDFLVGTQMIAKGLDFKNLTLVGLVMADISLNIPDFRSAERSYQLITQMSGRAGRHSEKPGKVFIQTYSPNNTCIIHSTTNNFTGYANEELQHRKELKYPPFGKLVSFKILGANNERAKEAGELLRMRAEKLKEMREPYKDFQILGPAPAAIARLRNKYRYHIIVKSEVGAPLSTYVKEIIGDKKWIKSGVRINVDIDPQNMM